jgi:predicted metal-binding membrane protein
MSKKLKRALTHPVSVLTGALTGFGFLIDPNIVIGVITALWASAGTLFTATSVAAFSVVPNVPSLSPIGPIATTAALVAGGLYVTKLLNRVYNRIQERV